MQNDLGTCELKKNICGEHVSWMKIVWMKFSRAKPNILMYKYTYEENVPFMELNFCVRQLKRATRKDAAPTKASSGSYSLPVAYNLPLNVSASKKKDLLLLCKDLTIPAKYHSFYENLKTGPVTPVESESLDEGSDSESNDGDVSKYDEVSGALT